MFMQDHHAVARAIGLTEEEQAQAEAWIEKSGLSDPAQLWRVVEVQKDHVLLGDGFETQRARVPHVLLQALADEADALAVGDWVMATRNALGEWGVQHRLRPRNQLARRLHDGRDKISRVVIVSNVDCALLVMGLDLDFNVRRLQRYLALTALADVPAVVVLTKRDLLPDDEVQRRQTQAQGQVPAHVPVLAVSGLDPRTPSLLQPWMPAGQTLVLLGSSGAGKSTLTNALCNAAVQDTGPIRSGDGRGRHTTTVRTLHRTAQGACIIDTPGLRTLRLDSDEAALQRVFEDVSELSSQCKFRNCQHQGEPGCAVSVSLDPERLRNWHKLQREAQRDQMSALDRQRQRSEWKQRSRAGLERAKDKRA